MGRAVAGTLALGLLLGTPSSAEAQSGPQVVEHGSPEAPEVEPTPAEEGRGVQYGAHLVVPFWVTNAVPGDNLRPGVGVQGRIGWEFPRGLSAELIVGYMWNRVQVRDGPDPDLEDIWVGVGGRYAFLNPTAFVPFVGVGAQVNFWRTGADRIEDTFGFNATVGGIFEVSEKAALEVGIIANLSTEGDQFNGPEAYLSPFAGGTLYF